MNFDSDCRACPRLAILLDEVHARHPDYHARPVLAGSLAPNHIRLAWNRRKNHRSGLPMLALTLSLAATGYALYYFATDDNAAWLPLLHWIAGLALPLILMLHIRLGRHRALPASAQSQHPPQFDVVAASYNPPARIKASS